MIKLYNTRTKQLDAFHPLNENTVTLYSCGPTVYHYIHIGNMRTFLMVDLLKRVLQLQGYNVNHVMNITDVGHLSDNADEGEDKLEKEAKKEKKTAWDIAAYYTNAFLQDLKALHILPPTTLCKATDHIPEQIAQVQTLIDKGFTYETEDGIYFDTTKFSRYGEMIHIEQQSLQAGHRVDMAHKKHPHDFALWKFSRSGEQRHMEWEAFGKKGFPGWHIECSAMATRYLGTQFDIHCGGIDLLPVHHTNEIAQAEASSGQTPWVQLWVHGEFLLLNDKKMARSEGTGITIRTLLEQGFDPLSYRYFILQAHYRKQLNFSFEALQAAEQGLQRLRHAVRLLPPHGEEHPRLIQEFESAVKNDLNFPEALAVLWKGINEKSIDLATVIHFDKVLGLDLHQADPMATLPDQVKQLLEERKKARQEKQWERSDMLRDEIHNHGFRVEDTKDEQMIFPV